MARHELRNAQLDKEVTCDPPLKLLHLRALAPVEWPAIFRDSLCGG